MKKILLTAMALAVVISASAFDLRSLFGGRNSSNQGGNASTTTTTQQPQGGQSQQQSQQSQQQGGGIGGLLGGLLGGASGGTGNAQTDEVMGAIGGLINSFLANDSFELTDLVGTWDYVSPAVSFATDNALQKIGGAAAATAAESKLAPYYEKFGLNKLQLVVYDDLTFAMTAGALGLPGVLERADDGAIVFNFKAFNTIPVGKIKALVTKAGNEVNVTFDVSRVAQILEQAAQLVQNPTLTTVSSLLQSYDGMYAGFRLKRN